MSLEIAIKLPISILNYCAMVMLSFALYRIPIQKNHRVIALTSVTIGSIYFYARFILESPYFFLILFGTYIIMIMILKSYPLFYSSVLCCTGILAGIVFDTVVSSLAIVMNLTTVENITGRSVDYVIANLSSVFLQCMLTYYLRKNDYGFGLIIKRFTAKQVMKTYNYLWATVIILVITGIQIIVYAINERKFFSITIPCIFALFLLTLLAISYRQNKRDKAERFPS